MWDHVYAIVYDRMYEYFGSDPARAADRARFRADCAVQQLRRLDDVPEGELVARPRPGADGDKR